MQKSPKKSQFLDSSKIISNLLISKTPNQVMLEILLEESDVDFSQDNLIKSRIVDYRI
jgi:allophanate hydrolase subunit 2